MQDARQGEVEHTTDRHRTIPIPISWQLRRADDFRKYIAVEVEEKELGHAATMTVALSWLGPSLPTDNSFGLHQQISCLFKFQDTSRRICTRVWLAFFTTGPRVYGLFPLSPSPGQVYRP
jgi:hypothetical protein